MTEDLSELKVGDKVYSLLYGWGKVIKFNFGVLYGLFCEFDGMNISYDYKGKLARSHTNQSLFTYNPFEKSEFPKWMETNGDDIWEKRYILCKSDDSYLSFTDTDCELSTASWLADYEVRELPQLTEMTIKEIEEKLGISNLKIVK